MNSRRVLSNFVFAALVIPTGDLSLWKVESFSHSKRNEVSFSEKGLLIKVRSSAGPIFYPLKTKVKVRGFKVTGSFNGLPKFQDPIRQGEKGYDDFPLRIGLVVPGEKRLSRVKKMFASDWVKRIYDQIPNGTGLDHVQFFNVSQSRALLGKSRTHPSSDLLREEFFVLAEHSGPFEYDYQFKEPIEAIALWISVDGDDTKSDFDVLISGLSLSTE